MSATLAGRLFDDRAQRRMRALGATGEITMTPRAGESGLPEPVDLSALGSTTVACLTGWDTPPLTDDLLDRCPQLSIIAHTGGTVRQLLPTSVFDRGITISHASAVLAEGVAEYTVLAILAGLRRLTEFDSALRAGTEWGELETAPQGRLLRPRTVGLVGASRVGRALINLLRPFGCRVLVHDPYLTADQARDLGVEPADLRTLLAVSEVLSLHAPLLPSTTGMIGAGELALLPDGALVVNSARAGLIDQRALITELRSGRLSAVLDVFHTEPLPVDSEWRTAPRTIVTPHIAALTADTLHAQGTTMIDEIERVLSGDQPRYGIDRAAFDIIA